MTYAGDYTEQTHAVIDLCQELLTKYEQDRLDIEELASKIREHAEKLPENAHPMLSGIDSLAFDIQGYWQGRFDEETIAKELKQLITDYQSGKWYPTEWRLAATYRLIHNGKPTNNGYSVNAVRQYGKPIIESAHAELKQAVDKLTATIDATQTDERYLQNVAFLLPENVNDLVFQGVVVSEGIVKST